MNADVVLIWMQVPDALRTQGGRAKRRQEQRGRKEKLSKASGEENEKKKEKKISQI